MSTDRFGSPVAPVRSKSTYAAGKSGWALCATRGAMNGAVVSPGAVGAAPVPTGGKVVYGVFDGGLMANSLPLLTALNCVASL